MAVTSPTPLRVVPAPAYGADVPQPGRYPILGTVRSWGQRQVLAKSWDQLLYGCGAAALLSLGLWLAVPDLSELSVFAWLMFLTSGPFSTFLPSASEPILMAFGKLYSPLLLAGIGVCAIALVEWLNYRVFGAVLLAKQMDRVRSAGVTRQLMAWFDVLPFATVVIASLTPLPFWLARCCAVITHYPMGRFILATAIGRFPRIWLIATIGALLPVTSATIVTVGAVIVLAAGVVAVAQRRRSSNMVVSTTAPIPLRR
jgi:membrane protein YqaA with SNARE-associated domain